MPLVVTATPPVATTASVSTSIKRLVVSFSLPVDPDNPSTIDERIAYVLVEESTDPLFGTVESQRQVPISGQALSAQTFEEHFVVTDTLFRYARVTPYSADNVSGGALSAGSASVPQSGPLVGTSIDVPGPFPASGFHVDSAGNLAIAGVSATDLGALLLASPSSLQIKTAPSGRRIEIGSTPSDRIDFYTGSASEVESGYFNVWSIGSAPTEGWVGVTPPRMDAVADTRPELALKNDTAGGSLIQTFSKNLFLGGPSSTSADLVQVVATDTRIGPAGSPVLEVSSGVASISGEALVGGYGGLHVDASGLGVAGVSEFQSNLFVGGALLAADGSLGAPGYSFTADVNTGIRRTAADTMALTAGGVDALIASSTQVLVPIPVYMQGGTPWYQPRDATELATHVGLINTSGGSLYLTPGATYTPTGTTTITHGDVSIFGNGAALDCSAGTFTALVLGGSDAVRTRIKTRGLTVKAGTDQDAVHILRVSRADIQLRAVMKPSVTGGTAFTIDGSADTGAASSFYSRYVLQSTGPNVRPWLGTGLRITNASTLNVFERVDVEFMQDGIVIGGAGASGQNIFLAGLVQNMERYGVHLTAGTSSHIFDALHVENAAQDVTVDATADTLTFTHSGTWPAPANGTPIQIVSGTTPGGLREGGVTPANSAVPYYVVNSGTGGDPKAFQIADTVGGAPVNITSAGSAVTIYFGTGVLIDATVQNPTLRLASYSGCGQGLVDLSAPAGARATSTMGLDYWRFQNLIFEYNAAAGASRIQAQRWSSATPLDVPLQLVGSAVKLYGAGDLTNPGVTVGNNSVGFNGSAAVVKQIVSGSRRGNLALGSLLSGLATTGLVSDTTTAGTEGADTAYSIGNGGSAATANLANGAWQDITLNSATCTLTLSGAVSGLACYMTLRVTQDATGGRTIVWPASVKWPGGTVPVLSTGANAVDVFTLVSTDGGTIWNGFFAGKGMA